MIYCLQLLLIARSFNLRLFNFLLFWFWWRLELWSFINWIHLLVIRFQIAWFCCGEISTSFNITIHLKISFWSLWNLSLYILLNWFLLRSLCFLFVSTNYLLNGLYWCWWCGSTYCWVRPIRILFRYWFKYFHVFLWGSERSFICFNFIKFLFLNAWNLDERGFRGTSVHQYFHIFAFFFKILNSLITIQTWFSILSLFVWSSIWLYILMRRTFSSLFLKVLRFLFKHFI